MADIPRHWAIHQHISQHGLLFLVREEGIRLAPYRDSRGLVTAAVGHLVTPPHTTITAADRKRYTFKTTSAAMQFFRTVDLPVYEHAVRDALGKTMVSRAEYDMC